MYPESDVSVPIIACIWMVLRTACKHTEFAEMFKLVSEEVYVMIYAFASHSLSQLGSALLFYDCNVTNSQVKKKLNM